MNTIESSCLDILVEQLNELQQMQLDLKTIQSSSKGYYRSKILIQKINMTINCYHNQIKQIREKIFTENAIKLKVSTLTQKYKKIVQEATRIYQLMQDRSIAIFSMEDERKQQQQQNTLFEVLKTVEEQLENDWEELANKGNMKKTTNKQNYNSINQIQVDRSNLKKAAKDLLYKQFLAIRMIAYRMYEQYTYHKHSQAEKQLAILKQQQNKILHEVEECKLQGQQLKAYEKSLKKDLEQLRRINDIVGKRYQRNQVFRSVSYLQQ